MTFSAQLEEKFSRMLQQYPEGRQRSAVVPMLIYAQDEVGSITPELIEEVARRCGVTPLQVDEVVGYYSMLHRKPMGKFTSRSAPTSVACWSAAKSCTSTRGRSSASDIKKRPRTGSFRSKKSSAWAPAPGRRRRDQLRFPPLRDAGKARSVDRCIKTAPMTHAL